MDQKGYRGLLAWQKSMDLVEDLYKITQNMPDHEKFGLTSQMRRSAVSIPSNIAEGHSRSHTGDYLRHLSFARGSLAELETQIIAATRIGYLQREATAPLWNQCQEVGRILTGLIKSVTNTRLGPNS